MKFITNTSDLSKYLAIPIKENSVIKSISTDTRSIKKDSMFISANKNSDLENVNNKMLLKETMLIRNALDDNLFRYDASELMERRIGADHLLSAMRDYILMGNKFITEITEELDSKY